MMGREFDLEEAEPHIRNKGWSPEFQTPRRKQKRREDAHAPRKSPTAGRNGASVNGILHEVLWSAMRPRIAFIVFTLAILCATCDSEPKW